MEVHAASVTYSNLMLVRGEPFVARFMGMGLSKPSQPIPGADIAGRVEAVGGNVERFMPEDRLTGDYPTWVGAVMPNMYVPLKMHWP